MAKSLLPDLTLRMASSLSAVPAEAWDGCANPPAGYGQEQRGSEPRRDAARVESDEIIVASF